MADQSGPRAGTRPAGEEAAPASRYGAANSGSSSPAPRQLHSRLVPRSRDEYEELYRRSVEDENGFWGEVRSATGRLERSARPCVADVCPWELQSLCGRLSSLSVAA